MHLPDSTPPQTNIGMSHPSFWQNEPTLFLAAAPPDLQGEVAEFAACKLSHFSLFSGGGAALQAKKSEVTQTGLFYAREEPLPGSKQEEWRGLWRWPQPSPFLLNSGGGAESLWLSENEMAL